MDNPLTPNKIRRLIHLAEDKSFNLSRRCLLNDEDLKRLTANPGASMNKTSTNYESSSGILDLDKVEGFGESGIDNISLSKSTAFNPGEMTGRSTGTEEVKPMIDLGTTRTFEDLGRHSSVLDSITNQMDKQTSEINDIMRHSIATNYSFHSKRDLTADEASLMMREAPLPVPNTQNNFADNSTINNSNMSVGAYFKHRCPEFGKMLGKTDSPDRSLFRPSITEVSSSTALEYAGKETNVYKMDQTLDSVPVKQSRTTEKVPENRIINNLSTIMEKQNNCDVVSSQHDAFSGRLTTKIENPTINSDIHKYGSTSTLNPVTSSQKTFSSSKPTDVLLRNLQSSLRMITDDTEGSVENSLSISKIADYLGKQSNVSVTDMLQLGNSKRAINRKQPLTELHMNTQDRMANQVQVATLRDSKKSVTASSAGSVNTVIALDKLKISSDEPKDLPALVVTEHTLGSEAPSEEDVKMKQRQTRSKSPSSKSQSTLSTVQENFTSFKSGDSPLHSSKGEPNTSHAPSPNVEYKELDRSVDWHEVLLQKRLKQEGLAKEQLADIVSTAANGFVGVSCPVTVTVTTLTDSWLTAKFQFDDLRENNEHLTVELPRFPILLSPGKSEQFTLHLTSSVELNTSLPFTMCLRDASIDVDVEQTGSVPVNIKMPAIQAVSCDGVNKLCFPPTAEASFLTKSFVLMSDCPMDLQLDLSISEGDSMFSIKNVQEMKKSDVTKVLTERQASTEEPPAQGKGKNKVMNKQLCRLSSGNAIKVTIGFSAPKLADLQLSNTASFTGMLNVNLIGVKTILRRIELIGVVGSVNLVIESAGEKINLNHDPMSITVTNTGTIAGVWNMRLKIAPGQNFPFKISPSKFDLRPGTSKNINMVYTGSDDSISEATITFEEITSGAKTTIDISGGADKPKMFPIKTNHNSISWIRPGRKEVSLKNSTNRKVHIKCQIVGDGFSVDLPGEPRGTYLLAFGPCECRPLPLLFNPSSSAPQTATLHLVFDKNSDVSRKVRLHGCSGGEGLRWSGLVTYGATALVRAAARAPVALALYNKAPAPAFVCATVHFNLQYRCVANSARLSGGCHVVAGRTRHCLSLAVDWARVERRARDAPACSALATVTVLTGAEYTRRRILKVLKDESNGELDTSMLPDHLKVLAGQFEGEDPNMDVRLVDFKETKASLNELIGGLQELTAQIDLPQDFADENTIIITDDTMIEHHTLCD
ncbi:uncharacterized protein LOC114364968 isoform X4 [Ostrinia furnacalis]|uniref:uncharacterized protein LOC114364968 isoform X4 n=1 Tax=Ostrinia furnacalis TaxID=93504 RepID=UPI0010397AFC|nr:uncharacterized protein LOC114364968 isoform X4 [Ostrinia furnacalis]